MMSGVHISRSLWENIHVTCDLDAVATLPPVTWGARHWNKVRVGAALPRTLHRLKQEATAWWAAVRFETSVVSRRPGRQCVSVEVCDDSVRR
jgi:hypothetical protein